LILDPTEKFYETDNESEDNTYSSSFRNLLPYLNKYRAQLIQVFIGLLVGSLLQLILPFLTQSIIDIGIANSNINFIYLILVAQIFVFLGRISVEVLRSVIIMHVSSRININLLSDFFIKLLKLPISYFDSKQTGDILQRITDHQRIESFLTTGTLNILFSLLNLVIFGIVLAYYNSGIFTIFIVGSILYFFWIFSFLKKRAEFDYRRFNQMSDNQDKSLEFIYGMQEIKLNNAEIKKRWEWEYLQIKLFKTNLLGLRIEQLQMGGSSLINELKNIFITFLSAKLVVDGEITLGMMLSISYITGQLNGPIAQLVNFLKLLQDAKLSMDRVGEVHSKEEEKTVNYISSSQLDLNSDLVIRSLSFKYVGNKRGRNILNNLTFTIPKNKITAVVGHSGSGKTTLMKLLLKFYDPMSGEIFLRDISLTKISHKFWRENVGVVMQEGYLFSDTITANIAVGQTNVDLNKLHKVAQIANINDYIDSLPLRFDTKIGTAGIGLSTGQKQRLLIARALYKDPTILFLDEATSALDAENERIIVENLNQFFSGRTVFVIAHRLSTVKNAHQIIVLENGEIVEKGDHEVLVKNKGAYFNLVKNQLELGN